MKYKIITLKFFRRLPLVLIFFFIIFMLFFPDNSKLAAQKGILLCGNVVIPSLFPFTFCVLFIMNSGILKSFRKIESVSSLLFGQSAAEFTAMIMSFIGGYPTGAKVLESLSIKKESTKKRCGILICCCVNAGPAFLVLAVGSGVLQSKELGFILLFSHIIASLIIAMLLKPFFKKEKIKTDADITRLSLSDNIVQSAADSAAAVLSVCGYVILFTSISAFADYLGKFIPLLKKAALLLEVTSAVTTTKNIYFIAFLTGFGGFCVWCQVFGMIKSFKINRTFFIFSRVMHGILSCALTYLLLKIFKTALPTVSNGISFHFNPSHSGLTLTLSLIGMTLLFIISTFKKYN